MRIYHKLHKNPCKSKRAKLIRNISERAVKVLRRRRNPKWKPAKTTGFRRRPGESGRDIFEDIFAYQQSLKDFHGLEVKIIAKVKLPGGSWGYTIEHPWFPPDAKTRKRQIDVDVCRKRKAKEIGAVSVTRLGDIGRLKTPLFEVHGPDEEGFDEPEQGEAEVDEDSGEMVFAGEERRPPQTRIKEGILIEEVGAFCCLAEEPQLEVGHSYDPGVLLCTGKKLSEAVKIGVGKRPEDALRDLHAELENLTTQELSLMDIGPMGRGSRTRPGVVSRARQEYLDSDPLSSEGPELKKKYRGLQSRLHDIRARKGKVEKAIKDSATPRRLPSEGTSLSIGRRKKIKIDEEGKTKAEIEAERQKILEDRKKYGYRPTVLVSEGALHYRYGEEDAKRLAADERAFKQEYLMKTGGKLRRLGKGKGIPLNERFLIDDTPLIGVIWDEVAIDRLTGIAMGKKGKYTWALYDGAGNILDSGVVKRAKSGAGKSPAARALKWSAAKAMKGGPWLGALEIQGAEVGTIQEAITRGIDPPALRFGEHLLVQFIPQEKMGTRAGAQRMLGGTARKLPRGSRSADTDLKDIMRWGLPTMYGLVEFSRSRDGYHVTLKKPSGEKTTSNIVFKNMQKAVEYAMVMMQDLTGIKKWTVEEGPSWSGGGEGGRTRQRVRNPRGMLRQTRNPDLFESMKDILAPPFITRPKRVRRDIAAPAVPKVGHHFREIAARLGGKEGFDFGFTFGLLRGIDTCALRDLAERRRIRRYIEQQVMDAIYTLTVEAPARRESNPGRRKKARKKTIRWSSGWNPKKNPDAIEAIRDVVAPQFAMRAKRKREPISVAELPDLKQHFVSLAWDLNGQDAYDFGFVFGVLRGIDTCGLMRVGERNRIRRRVEQEVMDAVHGLSTEVPGTRED